MAQRREPISSQSDISEIGRIKEVQASADPAARRGLDLAGKGGAFAQNGRQVDPDAVAPTAAFVSSSAIQKCGPWGEAWGFW